MKLRVFALLALGIAITFWAAAAKAAEKGDSENDPFWRRLFIFVGGDGGYNYISSHATDELNKHGYQGDAKGFLSYSWTDFTVDAGGGWIYNRSEGNASAGAVLHDQLTTKAAFARVAGRYRFTPQWELGVLNHILFGADTRFQTTLAQTKKVNWLPGVEAVYRIPLNFPIQLSGAFLTDATISGRQVYQILIGVQVGFPLLGPPEKKEAAPAPTPTPTPEPSPTPTPVAAPVCTPPPPVVTRSYVFDLKRIQFDFDSAKIRSHSMPMLKELGDFLAGHADAWEKLTIEGHTDRWGPVPYNQRLSERRAESVRSALITQGVKESSVRTAGYGLSRPLVDKNTKEAWQKNRRVEFKVEGIRQPELFDDFFRRLNLEY